MSTIKTNLSLEEVTMSSFLDIWRRGPSPGSYMEEPLPSLGGGGKALPSAAWSPARQRGALSLAPGHRSSKRRPPLVGLGAPSLRSPCGRAPARLCFLRCRSQGRVSQQPESWWLKARNSLLEPDRCLVQEARTWLS